MKIAAIAVLAGLGVAGFLRPQEGAGPVSDTDRTRFLFHGVFEGLVDDGAQVDVVARILEKKNEWFVPKCPLCISVHAAFQAYASYGRDNGWKSPRKDGLPPWFGTGFPKETLAALQGDDVKVRHQALEKLVHRYVNQRFGRIQMTQEERARMRESIKEGMGEGLKMLKQAGSEELFPASCPSCEGAN